MPSSESVRAPLIFWRMDSVEFVMRMRELALGSDLDIFCVGSVKDITRFAGAYAVRNLVIGTDEGERHLQISV